MIPQIIGLPHATSSLFREARLEDLDAVGDLLQALGYNVPRDRLEPVYSRLMKDPTYRCILAVSHPEGRAIGMITVRRLPCLRLAGEQVSIEELVVRPEWRGRGVGRALTAQAVAYAVSCRAVRVEVLTSEDRESTQRGFYEKAGFRRARSRVYRVDLTMQQASGLASEHPPFHTTVEDLS